MKIHIYLTGNGGCIEKIVSSGGAIESYIKTIMKEGFFHHINGSSTYYPPAKIDHISW
jgi:hypothetical protein